MESEMREIKFRAWEKEDKVMFGVGGLNNMDYESDDQYRYAINDRASAGTKGGATHQIQRIELMQYTGLKDKNGTEIYEGDILRSDNQQLTAKVVWETPSFALQSAGGQMGDFKVNDSYRNGKPCDYIEVIGNIYENPELLK